ncbi:hypothetical protein [Natrialbaceae archaeon AArc-T1-2]|uniref:hypothetical protein n=1 Tax=Natrialbaceae archaeon AArc-T1-2 TaxID=3053904 RepID=UPI00255B2ABF|nr:hypothetical protein [Natrialbaceae archaeon AArc-T1-2]WIV66836.1 hypothetical protein QQ977_14245 [Natrialbaceae archaeon AArc-T1-2]
MVLEIVVGDVLEQRLRDAVETYNRYREPMARATVLERSGRRFRVEFEGPFCTTCCRDDYVDDLRYELDEHGVSADAVTIEEVERVGLETYEATMTVAEPAVSE